MHGDVIVGLNIFGCHCGIKCIWMSLWGPNVCGCGTKCGELSTMALAFTSFQVTQISSKNKARKNQLKCSTSVLQKN